jgi:ribosomal RNA-processing protein 12
LFNLHDEAAREAHGTKGVSGAAGERAVAVLSVARSYAAIASKSMLGGLFKALLQRLLAAMNEAVALGSNNRVQGVPAAEDVEAQLVQARNLTALCLALVGSLDSEQLDLLVRTLEPIISEAQTAPRDNVLQKRAYKVLEGLCKCNPSWIITKRSELVTLLQQALTASSPSAKTARLHCLKFILRALYRPPTPRSAAMLSQEPLETVETISWSDALAVVSELVGDVILCTKEPNNKARAASFRVILEMAKCLDITYSGELENAETSRNAAQVSELNGVDGGGAGEFLRMLVGGLAAKTPHMRSASVVAISRIVNDYGHRSELQPMFPDLVRTVVLLLDEKSREVRRV